MKKLILSMMAALFASVISFGQLNDGAIILGTSSSLWTPSGNNASLTFQKNKYKIEGETTDGPEVTSFNLSPRIGYHFAKGLVAGVKLDYAYTKLKMNDDNVTTNELLAGPFARYYFMSTQGSFKPYLEGNASFGTASVNWGDEDKSKMRAMHFSGGAGFAVFFSECASFDFMAGYGYSTAKDPDSDTDAKDITSGFGIGLGFTIFMK